MTDYSKIDIPVFDFRTSKQPIGHLPAGTMANILRIEGRCYYLHFAGVADETFGWPHYTSSRSERASNNELSKYYNRQAYLEGQVFSAPLEEPNLGPKMERLVERVRAEAARKADSSSDKIPVFDMRGRWWGSAKKQPDGTILPRYEHDDLEDDTQLYAVMIYGWPANTPHTILVGYFPPRFKGDKAAILKDHYAKKEASMAINRITPEAVAQFRALVSVSEEANSLDAYQEIAGRSAIYPGKNTPLGLAYVALKLNGEAGEFAEHLGKAMRDDGLIDTIIPIGDSSGSIEFFPLTAERRAFLKKELGDQLWYIAAAAKELGTSLSEIAGDNLEKLADRTARDKLSGSGDER